MNELQLKFINFGSNEYQQTLEIRQQYLRTPLGKTFTTKDLESDRQAVHLHLNHGAGSSIKSLFIIILQFTINLLYLILFFPLKGRDLNS